MTKCTKNADGVLPELENPLVLPSPVIDRLLPPLFHLQLVIARFVEKVDLILRLSMSV